MARITDPIPHPQKVLSVSSTPARNRNSSAVQPHKASPAPITPPDRKARPVAQSARLLVMYAAMGAAGFLLATCSPAIAAQAKPGYADPAHKSSGPVLTGRTTQGAQPANGLFSCVATGRPRPHGMAGWDTARCAGFLVYRSVNPSSLAAKVTDSGKASFNTQGA